MKPRTDRRQTENIMALIVNGSYGLARNYLDSYKAERGENKLYRQMNRLLGQVIRDNSQENVSNLSKDFLKLKTSPDTLEERA